MSWIEYTRHGHAWLLVCFFMALGQQNVRDNIFGMLYILNGDVLEIHDCILNTLFGVVWCHCFRKQVFCLRMLPPKHQISDYISEQDAKWLLFQ